MPVIIPQEDYANWLNKSADDNNVFKLLDNRSYERMTTTPVSDWVNNPQHEGERCVQ